MQNMLVYSEDKGENPIDKVGLWTNDRRELFKTGQLWSREDGDRVVPSIVRNVKWNRKEMREGRG